MGYAIGLAPDSAGNGTGPVDMQRWIWSLYRSDSAQIARGGEVSGRSNMSYQVNPAVVIVPTGSQRAVAVPVDGGTVATAAAPSSGTRTDYIYVGQDGAVKVGASQPGNTALLDKRSVPAGITATTATTSLLGDRKYAPLFGGSMGILVDWKEGFKDWDPIPDARTRAMAATLTLDSDRWVKFDLLVNYDQDKGGGGADNVDATFIWEIWVDGVHETSRELPVFYYTHTSSTQHTLQMNAGTHTVELYRTRRIKTRNEPVVARKGTSNRWPGTGMTITDIGAAA